MQDKIILTQCPFINFFQNSRPFKINIHSTSLSSIMNKFTHCHWDSLVDIIWLKWDTSVTWYRWLYMVDRDHQKHVSVDLAIWTCSQSLQVTRSQHLPLTIQHLHISLLHSKDRKTGVVYDIIMTSHVSCGEHYISETARKKNKRWRVSPNTHTCRGNLCGVFQVTDVWFIRAHWNMTWLMRPSRGLRKYKHITQSMSYICWLCLIST